ncbi:MAG: sugar phosphate isomerase/epimerase [Clostridia bacterium]
MKVGISTATFFSKLLTEDTFSVIQRCGGEVAEVFLTTYQEYKPAFGELLKSRLNGLAVYSVHSLNTEFEPQLFNLVERTRLDAEEMFRSVLTVGHMLGASCYTFHGLCRMKRNTKFDPIIVGRRMRELGDIALEYGIKLCFENVHWCAFNSPEFFEEAKKYAPNIGAVLDIKQAWQSGRDWREYLDAMGDRLSNVHISDVRNEEILMVGKGDFPFDQLITRLKDMNYQGPLMIEQYAKNYSDFEEIEKSVQYIKNLLIEN